MMRVTSEAGIVSAAPGSTGATSVVSPRSAA
jgi:hypothetical protein